MSMFCYQCQEAARNTGCTIRGVCGKTDEVANLQDLLIHTLKEISLVSIRAEEKGIFTNGVNEALIEGLFATITNANFDKNVFVKRINEAISLRNEISNKLGKDAPKTSDFQGGSYSELLEKASKVGFLSIENEDIRSLKALVIYGLKGLAAYYEHAATLGFTDDSLTFFTKKALALTLSDTISMSELISLVMDTGAHGVKVMALLDKANTSVYGNPEITTVDLGVRNNPAILISGHDLKDLEELLIQSEGQGVDIYTHGEMLPAQYYPAFKKYSHFAGNYGNAWWKQDKEFDSFNGPILLTTNCLIPPKESYKNRLYATGVVGYEGIKHIEDRKDGKMKDFSEIIAEAKLLPSPTEIETGTIVGGFAHHTVFSLADKVVGAVKSGAIRKFFVMAGCDGRMKSREYYTEFAEKLPKDTVILTAGCAKYRYNKLNLGDINGIPRVLDAGQCNDSYSLAVIAMKLKEIFNLNDINELPIVYDIAWYEQKAVIVLLALLSLGVKNIHLGPTLPAFLTPATAKFIIDTFALSGIGTVDSDIEKFLG